MKGKDVVNFIMSQPDWKDKDVYVGLQEQEDEPAECSDVARLAVLDNGDMIIIGF